MKLPQMFTGIRSRLVLISILPIVVVALVLSWFSQSTQNESLSRALFQSGDSMAAYIAATAELSMYAQNKSNLRSIGQRGLKTPAVVSVSFWDMDGGMLVGVGESSAYTTDFIRRCGVDNSWISGPLLHFCKPVISSEQELSDFDLAEELPDIIEPEQLGWVVLSVSRDSMNRQQQINIRTIFTVGLFVVLAATLLALIIGRGIATPILALAQTIKKLDEGKFDSRAEVTGPRETMALSRGINNLAESVAQSQEELEAKVEQATSQLTAAMTVLAGKNAALKATQKDLETAMTAKDQFLASMSHELRTPLTAVTGFSRLLKKSAMDAEQAGYIENISAASELLLGTIDDLLNFSKFQAGALSLESIPFDLHEAMTTLIAMHSYSANEKSLRLSMNIHTDVPRIINGDPTRIKQVINNLISNAIKFTDQGVVELNISKSKFSFAIESLCFSVTDTGIGIDKESQKSLFEPFSQADNSITRRFGGTGLGLVICKQLVEMMGGSIALNSSLGRGSEVRVLLPLTVGAQKANESIETALTAAADKQLLSGMHILIAEDNHFNQRLIKAIVESLGAVAVVVNNGSEALLAFECQHYDVVLMDVHMPIMDGITATERIVNRACDEGVVIIGLTANVVENERAALLAAGAVDILFKPLDEKLLISTICELTGRTYTSLENSAVNGLGKTASKPELVQELKSLVKQLIESLNNNMQPKVDDLLHQLLGLIGIYGLTEIKPTLAMMKAAAQNKEITKLKILAQKLYQEINMHG